MILGLNNYSEINNLKENYFVCATDTFFVDEKEKSISGLGECCILDSIFVGNLQSSKVFITWINHIEFSEYGDFSFKCRGKKIRGKYAFESILEKLLTNEKALTCKDNGVSLHGNRLFELMIESIKVFKDNLTVQEFYNNTRSALSKTHFDEVFYCEGFVYQKMCEIIYHDYKSGEIVLKDFGEN